MGWFVDKLQRIEEERWLCSEDVSKTRNIEQFYLKVYCALYWKDSIEWWESELQTDNALQLFLLSYALSKNIWWRKAFEWTQTKVENKILEIKGREGFWNSEENSQKWLTEIATILLRWTVEDLTEDWKDRIHILENIVWKRQCDLIVKCIDDNCDESRLELSREMLSLRGSTKIDVEAIFWSQWYLSSNNKPQYLVNQGLSYKRWIEVYYEKVREKCFPEWCDESETEVRDKMQKFNIAYILCKYKFQDIKRSSWERYFDHLLGVLDLYLENEKEPTINGVLIAILHDIVEDTDIDGETLDYLFWLDVSYSVCNDLSKSSVEIYTRGTEDEAFFDTEIESWFLNLKWDLSDSIKKKKYFGTLTPQEKNTLQQFQDIEKKHKKQRNTEYFKCFLEKGMKDDLSKEQKRNLRIKCYDRLHNTKTLLWFLPEDRTDEEKMQKWFNKILSKIDETITYFLPITAKHFPEIHDILVRELDATCLALADALWANRREWLTDNLILPIAEKRREIGKYHWAAERTQSILEVV